MKILVKGDETWAQYLMRFDITLEIQNRIASALTILKVTSDQAEIYLNDDGSFIIVLIGIDGDDAVMGAVIGYATTDLSYFVIPHGTRDVVKPQPEYGLFVASRSMDDAQQTKINNQIDWYKEGLMQTNTADHVSHKGKRKMRWDLYFILKELLGI